MAAVVARLPRPRALDLAPVVLVGLTVGIFGWAMEHTSYDVWGGMVVGLALAFLSIPLLAVATRKEPERIARLIKVGCYLKLAAAVARYGVAFGLYDGTADASTYHDAGVLLAPHFRGGIFEADVGEVVGTGFMKILTGIVYVFTGPTSVGGFFVYSWLGFWGLFCFYRAFCTAVPAGDRYRYALLIFLLPSLVFWPSSIGKEAWMTLTLGLASLGVARILAHNRGGFMVFAVGLAGMAIVRPHVSLLLVAGVFAAYAVRRTPSGESLAGPFGKVAGILVLGVAVALLLGSTEKVLGIDNFDSQSVELALENASNQTAEGSSTFTGGSTDLSPSRFPQAVVGVLFRPFPWEAHNLQASIAAAEALVLVGLFVAGRHRIVGAFRSMIRVPYITFCVIYSVLFTYAFSSFSNFGVLTRQRVQVFPFVLALLAVRPLKVTRTTWRRIFVEDETEAEGAPVGVE